MAYTLDDFIKLNPNYQKRYDPNTKTSYVSNTKTGKEISFLSGQGQQYGFGGLQNGSNSIADPNKLISALSVPEQPKYESPYTGKIGETLATIQNRGSFNYDPSDDQGLQAAQSDAMGAVSRAASRRNMLYSDSNKSQMGKSALALVPQFRQQAFNEYQQQGQDLYSQLQALLNTDNVGYGRYRDTVGDTRYLDELEYGRGQNAFQNQLATNQDQRAASNSAMNLRIAMGGLTGIDPRTGKPTYDAQQDSVANNAAAVRLARSGGGGSSSGGSSSYAAQVNGLSNALIGTNNKTAKSNTNTAINGTIREMQGYEEGVQAGATWEELMADFNKYKDQWANLGYDLNKILDTINKAPRASQKYGFGG